MSGTVNIDPKLLIVPPSLARDVSSFHDDCAALQAGKPSKPLVNQIAGVGYLLVRGYSLYLAAINLKIDKIRCSVSVTVTAEECFRRELSSHWHKNNAKTPVELHLKLRRFRDFYAKLFPDGIPGSPGFYEYATRNLGVPEEVYRALWGIPALPKEEIDAIKDLDIKVGLGDVIPNTRGFGRNLMGGQETTVGINEQPLIEKIHFENVEPAQKAVICPSCGNNLMPPDLRFSEEARVIVGARLIALLANKVLGRLSGSSKDQFILAAIKELESKRHGQ